MQHTYKQVLGFWYLARKGRAPHRTRPDNIHQTLLFAGLPFASCHSSRGQSRSDIAQLRSLSNLDYELAFLSRLGFGKAQTQDAVGIFRSDLFLVALARNAETAFVSAS